MWKLNIWEVYSLEKLRLNKIQIRKYYEYNIKSQNEHYIYFSNMHLYLKQSRIQFLKVL